MVRFENHGLRLRRVASFAPAKRHADSPADTCGLETHAPNAQLVSDALGALGVLGVLGVLRVLGVLGVLGAPSVGDAPGV
jgi:hypothetical protein